MIMYKIEYKNNFPGNHVFFHPDYDKAIEFYLSLTDKITTKAAEIVKVDWNVEKQGYTKIIECIGSYS